MEKTPMRTEPVTEVKIFTVEKVNSKSPPLDAKADLATVLCEIEIGS